MIKILTEGPWFVSGHFLSVHRWEPNFVLAGSKLAITVAWIRLPQLPMEYYDKAILEKVGNRIGKLLKIDTCISSTIIGRYARICVQVPLEISVTTAVTIGTHNQSILYEGEGILCKACGRIGHMLRVFSFKVKPIDSNIDPDLTKTSTREGTMQNEDSQ